MSKRLIIVFILFGSILCKASATSYTPVPDKSSTYKPTQIINGDFNDEPWMDYITDNGNGTKYTFSSNYNATAPKGIKTIPNTTDKGWNTTENETFNGNSVPRSTMFDWSKSIGWWWNEPIYNGHGDKTSEKQDNPYLEMNLTHNACLYQDLTTYPGDIIRWTLKHGFRIGCGDIQEMDVQIGAPVRDANGNIVYATGVNDSIDRKIESTSNATYKYNSVSNGSKNLGSANVSELSKLYLTADDIPYTFSEEAYWKICKGVYIIPEGQTVTRFAFTSLKAAVGGGNQLDAITFSTLVGNLSAKRNYDGTMTIKGYWGDTDNSKYLCVKFDTEDSAINIDMTSVQGKNFIITITKDDIPDDATSVDVYHQDYSSAKRTIEIVGGYLTFEGLENSDFASKTDANPTKFLLKTETFTLNNPSKMGYEFAGWSGTGIQGVSKTVTIVKGSYGDREYTARWHEHEFKYVTNGSQIRAYCISEDKYKDSCPYHEEDKAITVFSEASASANLADFIYPVNATNKDLRWVSSNTEYVVVDEYGVVRGVKKTTEPVKLTAYSMDGSNKSYEVYVKVVD